MSRRGLAWAFAALGLLAPPAFAADTVYYYSSDTLHSEVVVTDQSRNVVERTYYAPYGQVLNRDLRDGPGYTGHEEDPETGLVYMQQRYYDPETGQFLSTDPVGVDPTSGGNFNRYAYANDNPYTYNDPFGEVAAAATLSGNTSGPCTGSHIAGGCASENLKIINIDSNYRRGPSVSMNRSSAAPTNSPTSGSVMLASNKDHTVAKEEVTNGAVAFAQEAKLLAEHGVLDKLTPAFFRAMVEMGARGTIAANTAIEIGKTSAGVAGLTFTDAMDDIRFYKASQTIPPTGRYYPGSLINWGRLDWRPFDPGLSQLPPQVWQNFVNGVSQLPGYSQ